MTTEKSKIYEKLLPWEFQRILDGTCPDCGGDQFKEGPSGGGGTNYTCERCGSEFNLALPAWGERITHPS